MSCLMRYLTESSILLGFQVLVVWREYLAEWLFLHFPHVKGRQETAPPRESRGAPRLGVGKTFARLQSDFQGGCASPAGAVPWNTDVRLPRDGPALWESPCAWAAGAGGSTCPVVYLPSGLQLSAGLRVSQVGREGKAGAVPPSFPLGPPTACSWNSPWKGVTTIEVCSNRCWGGHCIATSSSRFVGSLLNSGRKGKRGVKNDSKVAWLGNLGAKQGHGNKRVPTEVVYMAGRRVACFWWYCVCGLESQPCSWMFEMKLESLRVYWSCCSIVYYPVLYPDAWSKIWF